MAGKYDREMTALLRVLLDSPPVPLYSSTLCAAAGLSNGPAQFGLTRLERLGLVHCSIEDADVADRENRPRRRSYVLVPESVDQARQFVQDYEQRTAGTPS